MKQTPEYLSYTLNELRNVQEQLNAHLDSCALCPRNCSVNRRKEELGFCKAGQVVKLGNYMVHKGEEPPISGDLGSGTVFFAHCTLRCCYCQNFQFSQLHKGTDYSIEDLAQVYLWLQDQGCHNLNWVSPTQFLPQAFSALLIAREKGLRIPLIWNTSGWESPKIISLSKYFCDIFLMDVRYSKDKTGFEFSKAIEYQKFNRKCVEIAHEIQPENIFENGLLKKGIIIRLLVLPELENECIENLLWIKSSFGSNTLISLMSQYFPAWEALKNPPLNRKITKEEFDKVSSKLTSLGFDKGWIQDL
ncbi:MAG: radical SAM protein [Caldisericia bacterium]|nr:radical SAM protein [Caldisericia bacterium]